MEGAPADFHDWEVLLTAEAAGDDHRKPAVEAEGDSEDGTIKADYFALDSEQRYPERGNFEAKEEPQVDSDNPSWIDPESNSRYLDRSRDELLLAAKEFSCKNFGGFWSDGTSDGQRSHLGSENGELEYAGGSEAEETVDGATEENETDVLVGGVEMNKGRGMGDEDPEAASSDESVKSYENSVSGEEIADKSIQREDVSAAPVGDKKGMVWWKLPFELLKFSAFRVKPVWSISIAAAVIGVLVLGKRLYKMKQKTRSIPPKIRLDEKASQLKLQVARLNEAFSAVKSAPVLRVQLPSNGLVPWPVLVGFQ